MIWKIDSGLKQQLLKWNINLSERHRDDKFALPVPATFVIDKGSKIRYRFVEEDYFIRAEPDEVLEVYKSIL